MFSTLLQICSESIHFLVEFTKKNGKPLLTVLILTIIICSVISLTTSQITIKQVDKTLVSFRDTIRGDINTSLIQYDRIKDSLRVTRDLEQINKQTAIKSQLKSYRKDIKCDYLLVAQFHNTVKSIGGCPFIKFSITYNIYREGLPSIDIEEYQNVSISKFDVVVDSWDNNTSAYNIEEIKHIDNLFYNSLKTYTPTVETVVLKKLYVNGVEDGAVIYMFNKHVVPDLVQIDNYTDLISNLISA